MSQVMPSVSTETRRRILTALAQLVREGELSDFSVQAVADRCGVSHRTVYRYFPTRESMLDGLVAQMAAVMEEAGGAARVETVDDLRSAVAANFAMFSQHPELAEAAVRFSVGSALENRDRRQRTDDVTAAVKELGIGDDDVRIVTAVLRHLTSSRTWLLLREAGLDDTEVPLAAAWAAGVLTEAVRHGNLPGGTVAVRAAAPSQRAANDPEGE